MTTVKPFKPLDEKFPFERQLCIAAAPVVLINLFMVDPADEAGFLDAFKAGVKVGSLLTLGSPPWPAKAAATSKTCPAI